MTLGYSLFRVQSVIQSVESLLRVSGPVLVVRSRSVYVHVSGPALVVTSRTQSSPGSEITHTWRSSLRVWPGPGGEITSDIHDHARVSGLALVVRSRSVCVRVSDLHV